MADRPSISQMFQSLSGRESDRRIKMVLQAFVLNTLLLSMLPSETVPKRPSDRHCQTWCSTVRLALSGYESCSSHTHYNACTIAVDCFVLYSVFFLCSAFSNKLHILKTIAHCTNSSLLNSFVPWHTISPCRQSQTSCTVQRFSCPASTKKDLFEGCNRYPNK